MNHKVRLGPVAVFLAVVVIVLSTLAMLTFATSNADRKMAERFARVTMIKYELEDKGSQYIRKVDEEAVAGRVDAAALGAEQFDGGIRKTISKDGYDLVIEISEPDGEGEYEIKRWELIKQWDAEDPLQNIWQGGN